MNQPQFKIHGHERRALKKDLSLLKKSIHMFWYWWSVDDDMYSALGHENPHPNQEAQRNYDKVLEEIEEMEELLSEPYEEENK